MDSKRLNQLLSQHLNSSNKHKFLKNNVHLDPYSYGGNTRELLKDNLQYVNAETIDIILGHYDRLIPDGKLHQIISCLKDASLFKKEHLEHLLKLNLFEYRMNDDKAQMKAILNLFKCDGITVCSAEYPETLCLILDNMTEHKTMMDDNGFAHICRCLKCNILYGKMSAIFDLGYVPPNNVVEILLRVHYRMDRCILYIINRFELKLTGGQRAECHAAKLFLPDEVFTINQIEEMFKDYTLAVLKKKIPKEMKLTQQCLYSACHHGDLKTIRKLVEIYKLKPDSKCLDQYTTFPLEKYLIANGAEVTDEYLAHVIPSNRMYVYDAWKNKNTLAKIEIDGID